MQYIFIMQKKHGAIATAYGTQNPPESDATGSQLLKKLGAWIRKKAGVRMKNMAVNPAGLCTR